MADEDIELILDICLYRGENLVVGSVASPQIANMLMYAFDLELKQMLDGFGSFRYTRYADDIVISSMSFIDEQVLKQTLIGLKILLQHCSGNSWKKVSNIRMQQISSFFMYRCILSDRISFTICGTVFRYGKISKNISEKPVLQNL